ncbi:MAG: DUF5522 domain-containing protein [Candidatus Poriferisodalaceae bacterium]
MISEAAQLKHDEAEAAGEDTYKDPDTGFEVFTASCLKRQVWCCGSGCRHCPW